MSALRSMSTSKLLEELKYQFWWWPTTCSTCSCDGCNNPHARGGRWCRHCIYSELSSRPDVDVSAVQRLFELYEQKVEMEIYIQAAIEQVIK